MEKCVWRTGAPSATGANAHRCTGATAHQRTGARYRSTFSQDEIVVQEDGEATDTDKQDTKRRRLAWIRFAHVVTTLWTGDHRTQESGDEAREVERRDKF